ncbi:hypothetical protein MKX03_019974, partial [Papaver bracteatum]
DYVHRSGITAIDSAEGCSISLINPNDKPKFSSLCKSLQKESLRRFPLDNSYMPEIIKRLSIARQIDKITHKDSKEKVNKNFLEHNDKLVELVLDEDDSEEERMISHKQRKATSSRLIKLQTSFPLLYGFLFLYHYFVFLSLAFLLYSKLGDNGNVGNHRKRKPVVIGQDCIEPLQALRSGGHEV